MTVTTSAGEIGSIGKAVAHEAQWLAGVQNVSPPPPTAFGKLLEPPARHTFPDTTTGLDSYVDDSSEAVQSVAEGLGATAAAYRLTEEEAEALVQQIIDIIHGGAGGTHSGSTPPPAPEITPKQHWADASTVLGEGAAAGGDSVDGGNPLAVLAPAPLEWLNFPVAVSELVTSALGFLAASVISYFGPFDEALEELTGDPEAVRAFGTDTDSLAESLRGHQQSMSNAGTLAPNWSGAAASAFADYLVTEQDCMAAAEALVGLIGPSVEGVAQNTAAARKMVVAIIANILDEIVRYVTPRLFWLQVALGLSVAPAGFIVSGAILAGLVVDFVAWVLAFLATEMQTIAQVMRDVAQQGTGYLGQIRQLGESMERAGVILETGKDPGTGYGVEEGSTADSMLGTGHDERDGQVLDLLADPNTEGFTDVSGDPAALAQLGLTPDMLSDPENGFGAHVYQHEDGTYVVVFDGTDFTDPTQTDLLQENVPGGTGMGPQSEMAMDIAQAIADSPQGDTTIYGGHSLGGRLAAVAAMTSGNPAITANAAGVSPAQMEYIAQQNGMTHQQLLEDVNGGMVRAYITDDDILTGLQEDYPITPGLMPDAVGTQFDLGGSRNPVDGHDADNVVQEYDAVYGEARPQEF